MTPDACTQELRLDRAIVTCTATGPHRAHLVEVVLNTGDWEEAAATITWTVARGVRGEREDVA
jgi:hypothetical protein